MHIITQISDKFQKEGKIAKKHGKENREWISLIDEISETNKTYIDNNILFQNIPLIFFSILSNDINSLHILLKKGFNPNIVIFEEGITPIMIAVGMNNLEATKLLIRYNCELDKRTKTNIIPLVLAISKHYNAIAMLLIENGSNIDGEHENDKENHVHCNIDLPVNKLLHKEIIGYIHIRNVKLSYFVNPLRSAIVYKNKEMQNYLISIGADVNNKDKIGRSSLLQAIKLNSIELINKLIEHNANIHVKMKDGWTLLMEASLNGFLDIANLLIAKGVNVNDQTIRGKTALIMAVIRKDLDMVKLLIKNGADQNAKMEYGSNSISIAVINDAIDIIEYLLKEGGDPNKSNMQEFTPLMFAAQNNNYKVISMLIKHGADPNIKNYRNEMAIHYIATAQNTKGLDKICKETKDINCKNIDGNTPLMLAIMKKRADNAKMLLKYGADPNIPNNAMSMPIIEAVKSKSTEIVKILLDYKIDTSVRDSKGRTLSELAIVYNKREIFTLVDPLSPRDTIVTMTYEDVEEEMENYEGNIIY